MGKIKTASKTDNLKTARRISIIGVLFAVSFGILVSRAVVFHLKNNSDVEKVALRQYRTAVNQSGKRGKILDVAGRNLAIDVTVDSIYASPREIESPVTVADKLSKMLSVDRRKLLERLSSGRKFAWVKRRVDEKDVSPVMDLNIKGIYSMRENSRSYPNKDLAATILGAVGYDSEPLGGVELEYDEVLSATSRGGDVKRDARGHLYLSPSEMREEAKVANIELTIDKTLQYIVEKELNKAVLSAKAKGAVAIVVDVASGAVLAIANYPTFDPNDYEKYDLSSWKNRTIADAYEPGSTFKTIIVASALERGRVTPSDIFDCEGGKLKIGNKIVHDSHPHGRLSVADIIRVSSNIGAYKVEQKLGHKDAYEAIKEFGFGAPMGIDLPGESPGLLTNYEKWSEIQFATIAFGQGIAVTPLQMAMAFAAIANGGTLYKPYVVKRIVMENGEDIYMGERQVISNPISPATSKTMTELLTRVTQKGGTGTQAASNEYLIAGKTGTAQKADLRTGGYAKGKFFSSFVGFAPADAPRVSIYIGIDEPQGAYYGGQVAAPVFREIADATLHYLKVPGSPLLASKVKEEVAPPKGYADELVTIESDDREVETIVENGSRSWRLPDFRGLTMRGVLEAAKDAEINWKFEGSGIAVSQSPEPGSTLTAGAECKVEFKQLM